MQLLDSRTHFVQTTVQRPALLPRCDQMLYQSFATAFIFSHGQFNFGSLFAQLGNFDICRLCGQRLLHK